MKKLILFTLLFAFSCMQSYSQDSLKTSSYSIGLTSSIFNNTSSIGYDNHDLQFKSAGHKPGLGYSEGVCFLYSYRELLFEFAVQYGQETDKFTNVPSILSREFTFDSLNYYTQDYLDYAITHNAYYRTSLFSFLIKVNFVTIETKKLSVGFGIGIAPCVITSEMVYNQQTHAYRKLMNIKIQGDSQIKTVGSINFVYSFSKKISLKASPIVSYYLTSRKMTGYYVRPFNIGVEAGLFYKLH